MNIEKYIYKFRRYLAVAGAVAVFFGAGVFIVASLPPRTILMATGIEGGANHEIGSRYREILAKEGVRLQLLPTSGSLENLRRLRDPQSGASALNAKLDLIDQRANHLQLPTVYASSLYTLRSHIDLVRTRLSAMT